MSVAMTGGQSDQMSLTRIFGVRLAFIILASRIASRRPELTRHGFPAPAIDLVSHRRFGRQVLEPTGGHAPSTGSFM
jgi:hypothetical protein